MKKLKDINLSEVLLHILKEMLDEVEIYKILVDIQGKRIPKLKLVYHGYYGSSMYVIGTTLAGTSLTDQYRKSF